MLPNKRKLLPFEKIYKEYEVLQSFRMAYAH